MTRFYGAVGYGDRVQSAPGVWVDVIVERTYSGDVIRNSRKLIDGDRVNEKLTVENSISIVSDAYATQNFNDIRYVMWNGTRWEVESVDVEHPRLRMRLGAVYNGLTP